MDAIIIIVEFMMASQSIIYRFDLLTLQEMVLGVDKILSIVSIDHANTIVIIHLCFSSPIMFSSLHTIAVPQPLITLPGKEILS